MQGQIGLKDMLYTLLELKDETWALYAFSRELLKQRIPSDRKAEMINLAIACGKKYAQRINNKYGCTDIRSLADKMELKIEYKDVYMTGNRVLFACYTPPNKIEIMKEPVNRAVKLLGEDASEFIELFQQDGIIDTILGHEIFHFVEDQFEDEIYTRTEKILLWSILGFKNYSTIRTLSEIGAMAFTKELNKLSYSPFIMDILLYYSYDSLGAEKIYRDVLSEYSGRCSNS